ncbi:glycosyltransferase [Tsukamurella sp. 8F]|uniref:glycosyltransferase n=1 Tax=unclassified Tsukamurella TaxID=2633480 RepID=UPI0023B9CFAD|nr:MULTISPECIES: glycosyltransferase [unclassified Tsukamurella]MDF0530676.1 glycosyltransferase [Tsukamurella sp. 8J]MDF0587877.1 glycosyltransferase [Tsukamurella sp. 8F]
MRILHVTQSDGGVASVVTDLVRDQAERGWDPVVACPAGTVLAQLVQRDGVEYRQWEATRSPGISVPAETARLRRIIDEVRPDVVHLHSSKAGMVGRLLLRGRIPTIFEPHLWSFDAQGGAIAKPALLWERFATRWTDSFLCVSDDELAAGRAAGITGPAEVVFNGVDTSRIVPGDRAAARASLGLGDGPIALCLARLAPLKGQDFLLQAWPDVLAQVPDATLMFVGDGPLAGELAALPGGTHPSIRWEGFSSDPVPYLAACDVVVVPSRAEGMALVPLEALASGRPVVGYAVSGMRHTVGDCAGTVLEIGDVPGLAREVARRLADRTLAADEGRRGRARAVEVLDQNAASQQVAELVERVASRSRAQVHA